ncbi:GMC family oxidoreductase [uncultured Devosia sp.]|uniref:GMC family oxidoreductase n=1 Tax=uncultured Devosia sp. TaxID=211434 RepID=UPI0035CC1600
MLIDFRDHSALLTDPDVVAVGAGAVGLCLAVDLARRGKRVILLEAGGKSVEPDSQKFFENASWHGNALEGLHLGRFRALGGTTNFWSGQLLEFDPIVFEQRSWIEDHGWPIQRTDLDDAYARAYDMLGLARRIDDDAVWQRLKIAPPSVDRNLDFFFSRWVPETNLARLFENEIAKLTNLQVVINAPVTALSMSSDKAIASLVIGGIGGKQIHLSAPRIILAQGTIEMARLLCMPLALGNAAPWAGNPWLGRGFADHVDAYAGTVTPIDRKRFHQIFDSSFVDGLKYNPKLKLSEAAQRENAMLGIAAHFIFNSSFAEDLSALKVFARGILKGRFDGRILTYPAKLIPLAKIGVPMVLRYLRYRRTYNPADRGIQLRLTGEQIALRTSRLQLSDTRDDLGMPIVAMDWQVDGAEIETMAGFAKHVADFLEAEGLAKVDLAPQLVARDRAFMAGVDDANHHMGMVRMGRDAGDGVVDSNLKVFGTDNLFVAGAATFRAAGFANPTLTAIALGLRLSAAIDAEAL